MVVAVHDSANLHSIAVQWSAVRSISLHQARRIGQSGTPLSCVVEVNYAVVVPPLMLDSMACLTPEVELRALVLFQVARLD